MKVGSFISSMMHAVGQSIDPRTDLYELFNQAGHQLFCEHQWTWCLRSVTLTAVAGQGELVLPADFGSLVSTQVSPLQWAPITMVGMAEIARLRELSTAWTSGPLRLCVEGDASPPNTQSEPRKKASVFPTPTANGDFVIVLEYRAEWPGYTDSSDDELLPPMPARANSALMHLARAKAIEYEVSPENAASEYKLAAAAVEALKVEDGRRVQQLGKVQCSVRPPSVRRLKNYVYTNTGLNPGTITL